jgi:hypothetical protein
LTPRCASVQCPCGTRFDPLPGGTDDAQR